MDTNELLDRIEKTFVDAFGRTPLRQRVKDVQKEATELNRWTDLNNLREELGDLLASALMMCRECGWNAEEVVDATLKKIERRKEQYRSLGRKTTVGILGSAFDPVTLGHIEVAKYVLDTSEIFDEVWLMPCYRHMYGKKMAAPDVRLRMAQIATRDDGRIKVFDYEIFNRLAGDTYNTVRLLLNEEYAQNCYDFSFIIGMDNANTFHRWANHEDLERMIRFVVVPRQGVERDPKVDWYLKPPHIYLGEAEHHIADTSSTKARQLIALGSELAPAMVDREVLRFINDAGLYGQRV